MEDERAYLYRSFLLFVGASLIMFGIMIIGFSQVKSPEGSNVIVVVGPFFVAVGRDVSPLTAFTLIIISLLILIAFIYLLKKYLEGFYAA